MGNTPQQILLLKNRPITITELHEIMIDCGKNVKTIHEQHLLSNLLLLQHVHKVIFNSHGNVLVHQNIASVFNIHKLGKIHRNTLIILYDFSWDIIVKLHTGIRCDKCEEIFCACCH